MKETTGTVKAVCKNCGHEWKPRNPTADTSRRKCSKCQSENVELKTEPSRKESDKEPTPAEINAIINKKTPDNASEEKTSCSTAENNPHTVTRGTEEPDRPDKIKIPPFIPILALAAIIGAGGLICFHQRRKNRTQKRRRTPAQENKPEEEPRPAPRRRTGNTDHRTKIVGL